MLDEAELNIDNQASFHSGQVPSSRSPDDDGSAGNLNAAPPVNTGPAAAGVGPGSIDNGTNNQNGYIPNNSGSAFMDPSVGGDVGAFS